jgi:integrase
MLRCSRHLLLNLEDSMQRKNRGGSVVLDKRSRVWNFYWWEDGKRRSKVLGKFPTKTAAWNVAQVFRPVQPKTELTVPKVSALIDHYRAEKMPTRRDTRRTYDVWLRLYILPRWGDCSLLEMEPRPVELWLSSLELAPKSRAHIRGLLSSLWDFAAWRGDVPRGQRNPMELVTVKGASKRLQQPRTLTVDEFQTFIRQVAEPFRTMALLCCCLGLRISECLALKWADVDWNGKLLVERGIVEGHVDEVKTNESRKLLVIDSDLLDSLQAWKRETQFSGENDWVFASPVQLGRYPWSYFQVCRVFHKAGLAGTHALRHTYRSWLDSVGTPVGVQQRLMRHTDVRLTMGVYGEAATPDMIEAHGKIVRLAMNGREIAGKIC